MKILRTFLLLVSLTSYGQDKIDSDEKLYNDATSYYEVYNGGDINLLPNDKDRIEIQKPENEKYCFIKANENFKKIIQDFPFSKHYNEALYLVGHFEFVESNYAESKKYLIELINKDFSNEKYYKRQSFFDLAEIAIYEEDFNLAQQYVDKINASKPETFSCGNVEVEDQSRTKFINEKLKAEMNKK